MLLGSARRVSVLPCAASTPLLRGQRKTCKPSRMDEAKNSENSERSEALCESEGMKVKTGEDTMNQKMGSLADPAAGRKRAPALIREEKRIATKAAKLFFHFAQTLSKLSLHIIILQYLCIS